MSKTPLSNALDNLVNEVKKLMEQNITLVTLIDAKDKQIEALRNELNKHACKCTHECEKCGEKQWSCDKAGIDDVDNVLSALSAFAEYIVDTNDKIKSITIDARTDEDEEVETLLKDLYGKDE